MTTPSLHGTPVNNVNFRDVNPVTTLDFFSLSQSNTMFIFAGSELHVPAKLWRIPRQVKSDPWSANNRGIGKDIYWVSDRGGSDRKNRPVHSIVIQFVTVCN